MEENVKKEELERFLRNVPNPVLLGVFGKSCPPCEEMEEEVAKRNLPDGIAFARVTLGNEPEDNEIADTLEVEEFPTVIAFCRGEEVARTSDPEELDILMDGLLVCGLAPLRRKNNDCSPG